jgi:hypothetical protein
MLMANPFLILLAKSTALEWFRDGSGNGPEHPDQQGTFTGLLCWWQVVLKLRNEWDNMIIICDKRTLQDQN